MRHFRPANGLLKAELPEQALTLSNPEGGAPLLPYERRKGFAFPGPMQAEFGWIFLKSRLNRRKLLIGEPTRTPGPFSLDQTGQPLRFESAGPVRDRPWRIAQHLPDIPATHPMRHEKHGVKPMLVQTLLASPDFILEGHDRALVTAECTYFHTAMMPYFRIMRNYICRWLARFDEWRIDFDTYL